MKPRPTQFGVRENTASSRQHASRRAVEDSVLQPELLPATERPDKSTRELMPPINEAFELSLTEPIKGATGGEPSGGTTLATEATGQSGIERPLTCDEAAELVRVHPKTIKRMARDRRLPGHFRFGRWFFYASELDDWMRAELHSSRHSCR
jgi:excisionase family DNA binding protein